MYGNLTSTNIQSIALGIIHLYQDLSANGLSTLNTMFHVCSSPLVGGKEGKSRIA